MDRWTDNPLVYVDRSSIHGSGLFAARVIGSGQPIGHYASHEVRDDGMHVLWVEGDDGAWVGYEGTNSMRFMNHSDEPNAAMDGLDCYALRDIEPGEEITIDYGWNDA